jgi:hypothetical protein
MLDISVTQFCVSYQQLADGNDFTFKRDDQSSTK